MDRPRDQTQWPTDEEAVGFAHPSTPIPVTFAQDEIMERSENNSEVDNGDIEMDEEKALPHPPPVYGNWRSSVVCTLLPVWVCLELYDADKAQ